MQLLERIRRVFTMNAQGQSRSELSRRLAEAERNRDRAREELEAVETEVAAAGVSGPVDELSLARGDKKIAAARAKVATWDSQVRRLEAAITVATEQETAAQHAGEIDAIDGYLKECVAVDAELDSWAERGGQLLRRRQKLNEEVFETLGRIRQRRSIDLPPLLSGSLSLLVFRRLYAFAGALAYGKPGCSEWECQQLGALAKRSAGDREHVMSQLRPTPEPPRAA